MRSINELAKMNIKPIHLFLEEKVNDESLNEGLKDWVKAGLEWVTKTFKYLKNTLIAKYGKYFVGIWDDGIMPVVLPIMGLQAYKNGVMDRNISYFSADPEDAPYVKTNVSEDMLVAKRKNTFESVEYPEIDWSQINENYLDPEFVKNGYQFITEADAKKGNPLDMQGNAEFQKESSLRTRLFLLEGSRKKMERKNLSRKAQQNTDGYGTGPLRSRA